VKNVHRGVPGLFQGSRPEPENPGLYRLVTLLKESKPKEKGRFAKMARLYFEEEQKKR